MARRKTYKPKFSTAEETVFAETIDTPIVGVEEPVEDAPKSELSHLTTDGDLINIWERRMVNPGHTESIPVRVKTPGMKLRWINLAHRGRFQRARYEQGWVPVLKAELVDEREIYGVSYTTEGFVCRGDKQTEMLMKMPLAIWKKIQQRAGELNTASYKKLRDNLAAAGYQHFKNKHGEAGAEQAAEAAGNFRGSIKFGTEKASTSELFE